MKKIILEFLQECINFGVKKFVNFFLINFLNKYSGLISTLWRRERGFDPSLSVVIATNSFILE